MVHPTLALKHIGRVNLSLKQGTSGPQNGDFSPQKQYLKKNKTLLTHNPYACSCRATDSIASSTDVVSEVCVDHTLDLQHVVNSSTGSDHPVK